MEKHEKAAILEKQEENVCGSQAVNSISNQSSELELNAHAFKKAPSQLLISLHILTVMKPFYCLVGAAQNGYRCNQH